MSRPSTIAAPVTTPSAGKSFPAMPKDEARCRAKAPTASKLDLSTNAAMRSRAVSLPDACCFSIRSRPPPSSSSARRIRKSAIRSCIVLAFICSSCLAISAPHLRSGSERTLPPECSWPLSAQATLHRVQRSGFKRPVTIAILSVDKNKRCDLLHSAKGVISHLWSGADDRINWQEKNCAGEIIRPPKLYKLHNLSMPAKRMCIRSEGELRRPLVPDHENLEAAVDCTHPQWSAIDGRVIEHGPVNDAREIHLAVGGIDGQGAGILARGQSLHDGVGVGHVLANNGEAAGTASIGRKNESAIGVVADGVGAEAYRQNCHALAGVRVQSHHAHIGACGKEPLMGVVDRERARALAIGVEPEGTGICLGGVGGGGRRRALE